MRTTHMWLGALLAIPVLSAGAVEPLAQGLLQEPGTDGPAGTNLPLYVDEDGDVMTGNLGFTGFRGIAFPGGALNGNPTLTYAGFAVCANGVPSPTCGGVDLQRRVASSCPAGSSVRVVNVDGTVVCQQDPIAAAQTDSIAAGIGVSNQGQQQANAVTIVAPTSGVLIISGSSFINSQSTLANFVLVPRLNGVNIMAQNWAALHTATTNELFTLSYTAARSVGAGTHTVSQMVGPDSGTGTWFYNANNLSVLFIPTGGVSGTGLELFEDGSDPTGAS